MKGKWEISFIIFVLFRVRKKTQVEPGQSPDINPDNFFYVKKIHDKLLHVQLVGFFFNKNEK